MDSKKQTLLLSSILGAVMVFGLYWYKKRYINKIPTTWEPVGKVKNLYLYPLKSGRRIKLNSANCTEYGLQHNSAPQLRDRCLVVYKENNKEFKTARTYPKLILISVTTNEDRNFILTAPGMGELNIEVPKLNENTKIDNIVMWMNEKVLTIDCGDEAADWCSNYILGQSKGLRLGFYNGTHRRNIENTHKDYIKIYTNLGNSSTGMYSDLSSILLINQASVDELNNRIPNSTVTKHNFRPNIVVEGENIAPYSEDNWNWVKIGNIVLRNVKLCTRCALTTIDPETGIKSSNHEPLTTLNTYRKLKELKPYKLEAESPVMGICMGFYNIGVINVGDVVYLGKNA